MPNEEKKNAPKKTTRKHSRKPNPATDKNVKINARGKGTRSQSNLSKVSGVGESGAKKLQGKRSAGMV